jgi:hypothetical protein
MRTHEGGRPAPRRPRHATIGLFPLDEAAQRFAALSDYPAQAPALAALLHAAGAHLRTTTLDGVRLTSLRWIAAMLDAARHGEPPSPEDTASRSLRDHGAPPPQPGDDEDDGAPDPDPDLGLDAFDTGDLDDTASRSLRDHGQGEETAPDTCALAAAWDDLDLMDEDDDDAEPVGGEHGEFS